MANEFGNEPNAGYNPFYHLEIYIQSINAKYNLVQGYIIQVFLSIVIVDGLDDTYVTIQKSDRIPKKQLTQGAFAKVDTPKGTVFSLYSGRVLSQKEMDLYIKLSNEQIQQVKDENSNNIDVAADFAESLWMKRYSSN